MVVQLLTSGARSLGFEPVSRHYDCRNWVSPASKLQYD